MKITRVVLLMFASVVAACSRNVGPPKVVEITGDDFMKFNVTSFEVKPGQKVTVKLTNIGELPKEATAHNWVLLAKEAYTPRFVELGMPHPERDYIAFEQEFYVLAKTKMLGPKIGQCYVYRARCSWSVRLPLHLSGTLHRRNERRDDRSPVKGQEPSLMS